MPYDFQRPPEDYCVIRSILLFAQMLQMGLMIMRPRHTLLPKSVSTEAAHVAEPEIYNLDALVPRTSGSRAIGTVLAS